MTVFTSVILSLFELSAVILGSGLWSYYSLIVLETYFPLQNGNCILRVLSYVLIALTDLVTGKSLFFLRFAFDWMHLCLFSGDMI